MRRHTWMAVLLVAVIAVGCGRSEMTVQVQNDTPSSAALVTKPASSAAESKPVTADTGEPALNPAATSTLQPPTPTPILGPVLPPGVVAGQVHDENGPLSGAIVRIRNTEIQTVSAADGSFTLKYIVSTEPISVTAWIDGYYVGGVSTVAGLVPVTITMQTYHTTDNAKYDFKSAEECGACHTNLAEWQADAHGQSARNLRFISMYKGTDVDGNESQVERDAGGRPLPPEPDQIFFGPGFKLDFPERTGNCAACHTPMASKLEPQNTCGWSGCHTSFTADVSEEIPVQISPTGLFGVSEEGITCDFCHKIGDVILSEETGLPFSAKPGISSLKLLRPPDEEHDLFLGTFDDVPPTDSYLPLQEESAFCASCHYGVFGGITGGHEVTGGVSIYNSFGEWLDSPYSDPETGQTCQDCHMPTVDYDYFVFPEQGGLPRGGDRIHNHLMPGANDETLLQNSVTMTTTARLEGDQVLVEVSIVNDKTGHHVPTGSPLRHVMLVVQATNADGDPLPLSIGPTLPGWTGNYAKQPGQYYAKILEDEWAGQAPTAAFWRDIRLVEDTRLPALATDVSQYAFAMPDAGPITIEARLIYRRAFQELMEQKGWNDPDIVMEEAVITVDVW